MPQPRTAILFVFLFAAAPAATAEDDPPKERRYGEGPLTQKDFRARIPSPLPRFNGTRLKSVVRTEIRFRYRYRYTTGENGDVTITFTKVDVDAFVLCDQSWNAAPEDDGLMDHEQGHFDITAVFAAMGRKKLSAMKKNGEFQSTAKNLETAKKTVVKKIDAIMQDVIEAGRREDRRYDDETRHGGDRLAQAKHRRHHRRLMEQFGMIKDKTDESEKP